MWLELRTANFKLHMAKHAVVPITCANTKGMLLETFESYHSRSKVRYNGDVSRWKNAPVSHWAGIAFSDVCCNLKLWTICLISTLFSPSAQFSTAITTHGINTSAIASPFFKSGMEKILLSFGLCVQNHLWLQISVCRKYSIKS